MLQEIYEQPDAIRRTMALYTAGNGLDAQFAQKLAGWASPEERSSDCGQWIEPA